MTNWDRMIGYSVETGINQFIGEYVKINQNLAEEVAKLYCIDEVDVINSDRSASGSDPFFLVLAKCDFPEYDR